MQWLHSCKRPFNSAKKVMVCPSLMVYMFVHIVRSTRKDWFDFGADLNPEGRICFQGSFNICAYNSINSHQNLTKCSWHKEEALRFWW